LNIPYCDFLDIIRFYNDPDHYVSRVPSEEELEEKKSRLMEGLNKLRGE